MKDGLGKEKILALYGLLCALAIILSYVEAIIPAFFTIPGIKLGLTNIVVIVSMYILGNKSAIAINFVRIFIISMLFGNGIGFWYSLFGGISSTLIMILLKQTKKFQIVTISVVGGVTHNVAQIILAMFLFETSALLWYLLILWIFGVISGIIIGFISAYITQRLYKVLKRV